MRSIPRCMALSLALLPSFVAAQRIEAPAPGELPGTERWIVTLRERPFDLATYRAARSGDAPAEAFDALYDRYAMLARAHQTEALGATLDAIGGRFLQHWWLIDACCVEIRGGMEATLAAHPAVQGVYPDGQRRAGIFHATDGLNHATDVVHQAGFRGATVTIAVPDSGFDVVDTSRTTPGPNPTFYVDGNVNNTTGGGLMGSRLVLVRQMGMMPTDTVDEHGTSVAAVAAGETWNQTPESDAGQAPAASIAAYAWSDTNVGLALVSVIINTWQQIVMDAPAHGIRVANMSYEGSSPPEWPDQQAMDAAVLNADLLIAVMAGNGGGITHYAHGATNVVSVGSVRTDTRRVSTFSSRGPLESTRRGYPDLVANGEAITSPMADGGNRTSSGTSYAAPQVTGAAALYRSVKPSASALEVRAALFATAQDVSEANPNPPYDSRNAYGMGYLRTDRLVAVANGQGVVFTGTITPGTATTSHALFVQGGTEYGVGLAWNRFNLMQNQESEFDLEVEFQGQVIARASEINSTYERVTFHTRTSGVATLRVVVNSVEVTQVPYAVVATEATQPYRAGRIASFGLGCGSPAPQLIGGGQPLVGRRLDLSVPNANYPGIALMIGTSNQMWNGIALPLDLTPFGGTGCSWLVSLEAILSLGPAQSVTAPLPLDRALLGTTLYAQAIAPLPGANPANLVLSNGVEVRIGGQ
ncbi:MAG: S8/S53 family peptidase [Planctomycetes bacterium]|nr:S8/S53 family peptidase [Planctomycetota bacterium]